MTGFKLYTMSNFSTEADCAAAGFTITHQGHCGACSSLQDLGVYMGKNLTQPTRLCGALGIDFFISCKVSTVGKNVHIMFFFACVMHF